MPRLLQGIVLPAFETLDDGDVGKQTAQKAIKSERSSRMHVDAAPNS